MAARKPGGDRTDADALDALRPLVRLLARAAAREAYEAACSRPSEEAAACPAADAEDKKHG